MNSSNRSGLFLMELILNLFIFAVCAVVCVVLLLTAHNMSVESSRLTQAVYLAQSAAEGCRTGACPQQLLGRQGELTVTNRELGRDGLLTTGEITVTDQAGQVVYSLTYTAPVGGVPNG